MSVDLKPGISTMSSTRSEGWSSRRRSDTQSRTETTSGTTTSSASAASSGEPSGFTPGIPPSVLMFSGTAPKSQSWPITDKSKTSDLKERFEPSSRTSQAHSRSRGHPLQRLHSFPGRGRLRGGRMPLPWHWVSRSERRLRLFHHAGDEGGGAYRLPGVQARRPSHRRCGSRSCVPYV
ncbi:uncharacterized protein [Dermacentor albipictus]|uniref:uncharacterized protein n=1 Tax=Dermacentor albipictus TaxID=60249 RepID=UPI0031FBEA29